MKSPHASPLVLLATLLLIPTGAGRLSGQINEFTTDLEIRHRDTKGKVDVKFRDREDKGHDITRPIRVNSRTNEQINIVIKDANTLLFKYTPGPQSEVDAQGVAALVAFAKLISGDLPKPAAPTDAKLPPAGGGAAPEANPVTIIAGGTELDYEELVTALDTFTKLVVDIPAKTDATIQGAPDENYPSGDQIKAIDAVSKLSSMLDYIDTKGSYNKTPIVQLQPKKGEAVPLTAFQVVHPEFIPEAEVTPRVVEPQAGTTDATPTEEQILAEGAKEATKAAVDDLKKVATDLEKARVAMKVADKLKDDATKLAVEAQIEVTAGASTKKQADVDELVRKASVAAANATGLSVQFAVQKDAFDKKALALKIAQENQTQAVAKATPPRGGGSGKPGTVAGVDTSIGTAGGGSEDPKLKKAKEFLVVAFTFRAKLASNLALMTNFRKDYAENRVVYKNGKSVAKFPAKIDKDITQPVIIEKAATEYSKSAAVTTQQADFVGTASVVVAAHQSIHIRPGAGLIYSFVKNPEYSVSTAANGTITIGEKASSSNALSAAATLDFYPDRYFGEAVEPFVQIGYSPIKDIQGILLGGGATLFGTTQFSGGMIYQQRRTLKSGQSVGSVLAKAEDLAVEKVFKPGVYIQVSVPIPFTK